MIPAVYPLVGLAVTLVVLLAVFVRPYLRAFRSGWFLIAVIVLTLYAGTKPKWRFTFENGLTNNGSYCTNDIIHASWTYAPAFAGYTMKWHYRDLTITNEVGTCMDVWHELPDAEVVASVAEATVAGATNMEVVCYAQYVPPPQVRTNGVYHVSGVMRTLSTTNSPTPTFVTPGVHIYARIDGGDEVSLTPTNAPVLNQ